MCFLKVFNDYRKIGSLNKLTAMGSLLFNDSGHFMVFMEATIKLFGFLYIKPLENKTQGLDRAKIMQF